MDCDILSSPSRIVTYFLDKFVLVGFKTGNSVFSQIANYCMCMDLNIMYSQGFSTWFEDFNNFAVVRIMHSGTDCLYYFFYPVYCVFKRIFACKNTQEIH